MPANLSLRIGRGLIGAILMSLAITCSGCAAMRGKSEDAPSFMPDWGNALRLPPAKSELTGLSSESRQIERNLGYE